MASTNLGNSIDHLESRDTEALISPNISRRKLLKFGAGAFTAFGLIAGTRQSHSEALAQDEPSPTEAADDSQDDIAMADQMGYNPDIFAAHRNQDPNLFPGMSREELQAHFNMHSEEITPDEYSEKFVELFGAALNLGCTYEEVKGYLRLDKDLDAQQTAERVYLAFMDERYTYPVFVKLFKNMSPSEAELDPMYTTFRDARHAVLTRFIRHARETGSVNEFAAVEMISCEEPFIMGEDTFGVRMDMRITNNVGDNDATKDYYTAEGTVSMGVTRLESGLLSTNLITEKPYDEIFNELEEQLAA